MEMGEMPQQQPSEVPLSPCHTYLSSAGTWVGHVGPGLVFLLWALSWAVSIFTQHIRSGGKHTTARSWYSFPKSSWRCLYWVHYLEPLLKTFGVALMVFIELRGDHDSYMNLLCQDGKFSQAHLHNWQHAASYPGFFVSGLVDFLGVLLVLPLGTEQTFLAMAFSIEGFLMLLHKKHEAVDASIHVLLGWTMLAGAMFIVLEIKTRCFWASCGRVAATMQQGVWLCMIAKIRHSNSVLWQQDGTMAPLMFVPVAYVMLALTICIFLLLLYVVIQTVYRWRGVRKYDMLPAQQTAAGLHQSLSANVLKEHDNSKVGCEDSAAEDSDSGTSDSLDSLTAVIVKDSRRLWASVLPHHSHKKSSDHIV